MASRRNKRKKRKTPLIAVLVLLAVLLLAAGGIFLLNRYRTFSGYQVDAAIEMSNFEENTQYYPYGRGFLKCASDGITYFTRQGIVWGESYSMVQPMTDISGDYIVAADMAQRSVYLYDRSGFVNRIAMPHNITDIEVSRSGVIAVASNDGNTNYLEIRDRDGGEILTEKSIFSSSGFLMDISMSEDGSKLAAVFVTVKKGVLGSRVVFYDLSQEGESQVIAGTFDHYDSVLLTTVTFLANDRVCVVGDTALSIYDFHTVPSLLYEESGFLWEIQSLFFSDRLIGMVVEETETETKYMIRVLDTDGKIRLEKGLDYSFNRAAFAGDQVLLYSYNDCLLYSLAGIEKLNCSFDQHVEALMSVDGVHFVYGTNADTRFITLK